MCRGGGSKVVYILFMKVQTAGSVFGRLRASRNRHRDDDKVRHLDRGVVMVEERCKGRGDMAQPGQA